MVGREDRREDRRARTTYRGAGGDTTACLLQDRLGLRQDCGALDFNLGCSGFVYGLALAKGLIETGSASRVLLLTADTYSRFIHPGDKSVRTLFGDGAAFVAARGRAGGSAAARSRRRGCGLNPGLR